MYVPRKNRSVRNGSRKGGLTRKSSISSNQNTPQRREADNSRTEFLMNTPNPESSDKMQSRIPSGNKKLSNYIYNGRRKARKSNPVTPTSQNRDFFTVSDEIERPTLFRFNIKNGENEAQK